MGAAAQADEKHWQRVMDGDRKVGFIEHSRRRDGGQVFESEVLTLELGKSGRRVTYQQRIDTQSTADGSLVRLLREARTREGHSRVEARVVGADLVVYIGPVKHAQSRTLAGAGADLKTDEFARAWRQSVGSGAHEDPLAFRTFDPVMAAPVEVELSKVDAAAGPHRIRRRMRAGAEEFATIQALNPSGEVVEESLRLGGLRLVLQGASEAEAKSPNQALDHVVRRPG
ncbi:MAG: hypothetical protein K0Q92_3930 [Steroidobacteraceae bacterium]|nr:hypothetical protein [Steroidobacteraceae bacterium]